MAFFPISHYRRYDDPIDRYFGDQLDFFNPWDDLNTAPSPTTLVIIPKNFRWVNQPQQSAHPAPHGHNANANRKPQSQKFRVQLNVAGFNPETINTKVEGKKVVVEAKQEERQEDGDYNIRQLRKSYELPEQADAARLVSYITPNHMLIIEVPLHDPEAERRLAQAKNNQERVAQFGQDRDPLFDYAGFLSGSDFQPRIVDKENNKKQLELVLEMKNYKPEEITVSVKNDELIVKGEHRHKDDKSFERSFFFKSTKLPPGTQVEQLQSYMTDEGQLKVEAPFVEQKKEEPKPIDEQKKEEPKPNHEQKK